MWKPCPSSAELIEPLVELSVESIESHEPSSQEESVESSHEPDDQESQLEDYISLSSQEPESVEPQESSESHEPVESQESIESHEPEPSSEPP